jgi:hypothetical protein
MPTLIWPWSTAATQRSIARRYSLPAAVGAVVLLMQGCATAPSQPFATTQPSDADARVPAASYRPVLSGYSSQRPVEPLPWREQNRRVTPEQKR